jgi:hypothetical protein
MSIEAMNTSQNIDVMSFETKSETEPETEPIMNEILTLLLPPPETFEESNQEQIIDEILMPPPPPRSSANFEPGKFEYVKTRNEKEMLQTAYQAVNMLEFWDFMKQPSESFTFSSDTRVRTIYNKIEEVGYYGHSGFSFGWTMRAMQHIARHGEEAYMKIYLNIS